MNVHVFNIKSLSTIEHVVENNSAIRYYKSPTLDLLKQNKIKEINILDRLMNRIERPVNKPLAVTLHKKKMLLHKILKIRTKLYQETMKSQISSGNL